MWINTCCGKQRGYQPVVPVERRWGSGHKLKYRKLHLNMRNNFFLWKQSAIETGCPERLWSVWHWRYSKPYWTMSWAACSAWPCLLQTDWTRWSPEVLSHLNCFVILLVIGKFIKSMFRRQTIQKILAVNMPWKHSLNKSQFLFFLYQVVPFFLLLHHLRCLHTNIHLTPLFQSPCLHTNVWLLYSLVLTCNCNPEFVAA